MMMAAKPLVPSSMISNRLLMANMYFTSLPFQPQCLNFKANIGISAMSNQQLTPTMASPSA